MTRWRHRPLSRRCAKCILKSEGAKCKHKTRVQSVEPTHAPTTRIRRDEDFEMELMVAMDYEATNEMNTTQVERIIVREAEEIINAYIDNMTNGSNDTLTMVSIDEGNSEYDIVLRTNYTLDDNATAVSLSARFEDALERDLLGA